MKTLPLLLLGLCALGSCTIGRPIRVDQPAAERSLTVIPLRYAVAQDVANALNRLRPNTRIVADDRTNSLVLSYASQADLKELTDCIAKLDIQVVSAAK